MTASKPITLGLMVVGAAAAILLGDHDRWSGWRIAYVLPAIAIACIPAMRRAVIRRSEHLRHRPPPGLWNTLIVAAVLFVVLLLLAAIQDRELIPKTHDEFMYRVQVRMLSAGRLWMPAHPLGDFFDSFFIQTSPRYLSVYFPGTALLYAPFARFELPYWLMPAIFGSALGAMLYRIVAELVDRAAAQLVPLILIATPMYRVMTMGILSHTALMLLALALFYAWLRWMQTASLRWAATMGLCAGWAAITRPIDALCYAIPLVLFSVPALRRMSWGKMLTAAFVVLGCAAPFLALQLFFDINVTGHALQTPYQQYLDRDQPGSGFGFHALDPQARPASQIVQKQLYYERFIAPEIAAHRPSAVVPTLLRNRLPLMLSATVFHPLLTILALAGLLRLRDRRQAALLMSFPIFVILYTFNPFMLPHYPFMYLPAAVLLVLLGMRQMEAAWPSPGNWIMPLIVATIAGLALGSLPRFNPGVRDHWETPVMSDVHDKLATIKTPSVVLFRFDPAGDVHEEPVYNDEAAWPDDQLIVRAHNLGSRNIELYRYYAQHQPAREIWLYDRSNLSLLKLGTAQTLAQP